MVTNFAWPIPITKLADSRGGMGLRYGTVIRPTPQADSEPWHRRLKRCL